MLMNLVLKVYIKKQKMYQNYLLTQICVMVVLLLWIVYP